MSVYDSGSSYTECCVFCDCDSLGLDWNGAFTWECWNTEIVVPWKELADVVDEKFLSKLSMAAVVKKPSWRLVGQTKPRFWYFVHSLDTTWSSISSTLVWEMLSPSFAKKSTKDLFLVLLCRKSPMAMLQSEAKFVTFCDSSFCYKVGQLCYKVRQLLQSGAKIVTKWGSCYKVGQLLQSGA